MENENNESLKEYVSDLYVTATVKSKFYADPLIKMFQISVETYKGITLLSGVVENYKQAERAKEIAQSVEGIKEVRVNFIIKEDV